MESTPRRVSLTFNDLSQVEELSKQLKQLNSEDLEVSDIQITPSLGATTSLILLDFAITILTSVGCNLLSTVISDSLKGEANNDSTFIVTIDDVEIECRSVEDVKKLLTLKQEISEANKDQETTAAYFRFADVDKKPRFVIKLVDATKIEHARRILTGVEKQRIHVQGTIVKEAASYNPDWSYHLEPESIDFFEIAIEVCDASICYVEGNLDDVGGSTLPNSHWCPWSSRLVDEVSSVE